jgi:hypothetical protein
MAANEDASPQRWVARLAGKLRQQARIVNWNDRQYDGDHDLPTANVSDRALFRYFQQMSRSNYVAKVVDAPADRLVVTGLRVGSDAENDAAWKLWQRSYLDSDQPALTAGAMSGGIAYLSVWPDESGVPALAPEHGSQVTHILEPGSRRKVAAALKVFPDEESDELFVELYLPDYIARFTARSIDSLSYPNQLAVDIVDNPYGVVPIVPVPNSLDLRKRWTTEMAAGLRPQARVNQTLLNLMVAGETVAFPQRWATGVEVDKNPDGTPKRPWKSGPDSVMVDENIEAKFGQFMESRLDGYHSSIRGFVEEIAATTGTPLFSLSANLAVPPSAEALSAMESSLVSKVGKRQRTFGESFEDAMRIALQMQGAEPGQFMDMEVIWKDPRVRSDAAVGDYLTKLKSVGVPEEALWAEAGATPQQIREWRKMAMSEAFRNLVIQTGQQRQAEQAGAAPTQPAAQGAAA